MTLRRYQVTLVHDDGTVRLKVTARNRREAILVITNSEHAPLRAVRSIKHLPKPNPKKTPLK